MRIHPYNLTLQNKNYPIRKNGSQSQNISPNTTSAISFGGLPIPPYMIKIGIRSFKDWFKELTSGNSFREVDYSSIKQDNVNTLDSSKTSKEKPEETGIPNISEEYITAVYEKACKRNYGDGIHSKDDLSKIQNENKTFIQNARNYDDETLKNTTIKNRSLIDSWLDISGASLKNRENARLKNLWFDEILNNENKKEEMIEEISKRLQDENEKIDFVKECSLDILKNEPLSTTEHDILRFYLNNKTLFDAVTSDCETNSKAEQEDKILTTLKTLAKETDEVTKRAQEAFTTHADNVDILYNQDKESIARVKLIFSTLLKGTEFRSTHNKAKNCIKNLYHSKIENHNKNCIANEWSEAINICNEIINAVAIEETTGENIVMLGRINNKRKDITNKFILKLLDNSSLAIEIKDFIARYAQEDSFKTMLANPNIDTYDAIKSVMEYESLAKEFAEKIGTSLSEERLNNIMADEFKDINKNAKDSIKQLEILSKIAQNTTESKQYAKLSTKAVLMEFEKNPYLKELIPTLTESLPKEEQVDINVFINKFCEVIKKENKIRNKEQFYDAFVESFFNTFTSVFTG